MESCAVGCKTFSPPQDCSENFSHSPIRSSEILNKLQLRSCTWLANWDYLLVGECDKISLDFCNLVADFRILWDEWLIIIHYIICTIQFIIVFMTQFIYLLIKVLWSSSAVKKVWQSWRGVWKLSQLGTSTAFLRSIQYNLCSRVHHCGLHTTMMHCENIPHLEAFFSLKNLHVLYHSPLAFALPVQWAPANRITS